MPKREGTDAGHRFDETYQACWLHVFRFALAWTNDWPAAEDIAQDCFARLWRKRETIDWSAPMMPWLLKTTRHLATDRLRRLRRLVGLTDSHPIPARDSAARLRWLDVQAGMAALTPVQRSALVMTAVLGLDYDSAAAALGTSPGAVRAAVSRARDRLEQEA